MKFKWTKVIVVCAFVVIMVTLASVQVFARDFYMAGHYDPTGTTTTTYAYPSSECDRKINVSYYDTSGNFLKKVVIHTKKGMEASFHIGLGGYDITKFESNQGLWETCKMSWTTGTGTCTEADLFVVYYFRTGLSKDELNITITMRKWDKIEFEVRHYVEMNPKLNNFHRDNYKLHSTTNQTSLNYYDSISVSKKTITGYTLRSDYQSTVSGRLCYDALVGTYKNTPSSPRCYSYDYHNTTYSEDMDSPSKFDESKDGKLDYCDTRKFWIEFFYDVNEYTVSYNANGGSGAPSSQTKYYGYDLTLSDTVPTRSGYTFKGWGTSSSSTSASYQPGGNYTANSSRTLYAIWESNTPTTYKVTYNANGGSGAPASQTKTHNVTLTLSSTKPTRTGYTFLGWSTSSSATSATYSAGGSYTTNASVTLYAVWKPNTYTVTYNANGGSGAPSSQTKTYGVTLTLSSTKPTRTGYTFLGWSTSSSATSATYTAGSSYTSNSSVTLYAVWKVNTYTVTYNANGGSGAPASQTKTYGVTLTLSSTKPTRTGYTFLGWSTSSTATSATYSAGGSYTSNSSATLYAVWSINTYTVSYNANGGSGAPSSQTKTYGVTLTLSSTKPTRTGYTFKGWATSSTATSATYSAGGSYTSNSSITLYAVWSINTYTVSYNANGGSGAPSSQTKTYGSTLTLSSTKPTRSGYDFLGWATSSTATSASYSAGGSYTSNSSVTLYAVWEKTNYEFSISNLTVSESEPYRYGEITVKVRTDSWDRRNAYNDIPVQLYYDGRLMSTQYVDFTAYGVANLTFTLYVGDTPGSRPIEVRINWANKGNETNTGNNNVTTTINVKEFDYEMSVDGVTMTDNYCAGETVISSFTVRNDSDYDITPDMGNSASFTAYYFNGSQKVVIATDTWNNVVIPSGKANLVYFKWTVPSTLSGKTVYCECTINSDGSVNEENRGNNTTTFSTTVTTFAESQTPNTRYENTAPGSYKGNNAPSTSTDKATWTMWVYENNQFVLKSYGVQISSATPVITPGDDCKTAVYANGKWTIRSGYGFTISYSPTVTMVSGYNNPGSSAYTSIQSVYATFPEFNYATTNGNYRTLQYVNGTWQFVQNSNAANSGRIHFIPVWFADGNYTVSVTATRVWTPVGVISATRTANTFNIDGSIYDDYFVGN